MSRFVYVAGRSVSCVRCNVAIMRGQFQVHHASNARCLRCAGLAHLAFVAPGDVALTRRSTRKSRKKAIVLEYDRRHRCYARAGVLVEVDALWHARHECRLDAKVRAQRREKAHARARELDASYVLEFASSIRAEFPAIPIGVDRAIAEHACVRGSRRVGRSARARSFDRKAIFLAVCAHIRHSETSYEALLTSGAQVWQARKAVQPEINAVLARWRG